MTMKFLRQRGNQLSLQPAKRKYTPMVPKTARKVVAMVKAVVRKY